MIIKAYVNEEDITDLVNGKPVNAYPESKSGAFEVMVDSEKDLIMDSNQNRAIYVALNRG